MKKYRDRYGMCHSDPKVTPLQIEAKAFFKGLKPEQGGLGKFEHFRNFASLILPPLDWNPWLERQLRSLCDDTYATRHANGAVFRNVAWVGCGAAGKTFASGLYAWLWWIVDMKNSIVVLTSTTKDMLRRRVWPVLCALRSATIDVASGQRLTAGHILPSSTTIQCERGNDKYAIFAMAVAHGETPKAVDNLKGIHAPRILLVIDEATGTPEGIFETVPNMRKACEDFTMLTISNPFSHLDPGGRICMPVGGWNSIGVDSEEWETKGVPEWQIDPGICLHFDGWHSPNKEAGKTIYPHIYTFEDYQMSAQRSADRLTLNHWRQDRGFWPPEGSCNTVMSEALIENRNGFGDFEWYTQAVPCAGLDPAFGGDECILQFGRVGTLADGTLAVQLTETLPVGFLTSQQAEVEYEIATQVIAACQSRGVRPEHLGMDATGIGRGIYSVISKLWNPSVRAIEFGGNATADPASVSDSRPGSEVYDNRVTQLWFDVRDLMDSGQLRGLTRQQAIQFCSREYEIVAGHRYRLNDKAKCKKRLGRSPDQADAVAVLCSVARQMGVLPRLHDGGQNQSWQDFVAQNELANSSEGYEGGAGYEPGAD